MWKSYAILLGYGLMNINNRVFMEIAALIRTIKIMATHHMEHIHRLVLLQPCSMMVRSMGCNSTSTSTSTSTLVLIISLQFLLMGLLLLTNIVLHIGKYRMQLLLIISLHQLLWIKETQVAWSMVIVQITMGLRHLWQVSRTHLWIQMIFIQGLACQHMFLCRGIRVHDLVLMELSQQFLQIRYYFLISCPSMEQELDYLHQWFRAKIFHLRGIRILLNLFHISQYVWSFISLAAWKCSCSLGWSKVNTWSFFLLRASVF